MLHHGTQKAHCHHGNTKISHKSQMKRGALTVKPDKTKGGAYTKTLRLLSLSLGVCQVKLLDANHAWY